MARVRLELTMVSATCSGSATAEKLTISLFDVAWRLVRNESAWKGARGSKVDERPSYASLHASANNSAHDEKARPNDRPSA
jgi:hypothetical protein